MKCPRCNREGARVRIKTQEVVCNLCGYISETRPHEQKPKVDSKPNVSKPNVSKPNDFSF